MLLVFLILVTVTCCVTIVGTYFLLNAENYHWQWTSFAAAASTAAYVALYSVYYFLVKTKMTGLFQVRAGDRGWGREGQRGAGRPHTDGEGALLGLLD